MLRKQLCNVLDLQRRTYAELAIATTNPAIGSAARTAMKSVLLTMKRVNHPTTAPTGPVRAKAVGGYTDQVRRENAGGLG